MWTRSILTDKAEILSFLETDRLYAAYAIGDLEPALYADCTWTGAAREGHLEALALHYRGLTPPAFLLMGDEDGLRAILAGALAPEWVYMTCRPEILDLTREFYTWDAVTPMWRLVLQPASFPPLPTAPDRAFLAPR